VGDLYRERGVFDYWLQNIGHGIALTIHEFPRIAGADSTILRENMVLAVEPILALAPYGAIAHCDGVLVTANGCEWLSGKLTDVTII
jgi:Xaa-Pro aminopeptidase